MKKSELMAICRQYKHIHGLPISQMRKEELEALAHQLDLGKMGSGIFKDAMKKVGDVIKRVFFFPSDSLPASSKKVFEKYKDRIIEDIQIRRAPLDKGINLFLNIISLGKYEKAKKELAYDDMFHLSMLIRFEGDRVFKVKVEKNQKINVSENIRPEKDSEFINVKVKPNLSLAEMFETTRKAIGDHRFYQYNAFDMNCQRFILDLLTNNGMGNEDVKKFILQDAEAVLDRLPSYVGKIAQFITDTAGKVQEAVGGKKKRKNKKVSFK